MRLLHVSGGCVRLRPNSDAGAAVLRLAAQMLQVAVLVMAITWPGLVRGQTFEDISVLQCGVSKGCLRSPPDCATLESCQHLVTYQYYTVGSPINGDMRRTVQFEMTAAVDTTTVTNPYVALGLSYDDQMGEDSVIACFRAGPHLVAAGVFYNTPYKTNEPVNRDNIAESLTSIAGVYQNGRIQCRLSRDISSPHPEIYDLTNSLYIMIAKGNFDIFRGRLAKHDAVPVVSSLPIRIVYSTPDDITTQSTSLPTTPLITTQATDTGRYIDLSGCGSTHLCTWYPPSCVTNLNTANNCQYLLAMRIIDATPGSGQRYLQVAVAADVASISNVIPANGYYISLGFSYDKHMNNDSVILCASNGDGSASGHIYYNHNYKTIRVDQASHLIQDVHGGVTNQDILWCSFRRLAIHNLPPNIEHIVFDVTSSRDKLWYLLMAKGKADNGKPLAHDYQTLPLVSHCGINISHPTIINTYPANVANDNQACQLSNTPPSSSSTSHPTTNPPSDITTNPSSPVPMAETATASAWPTLTGNWRYFLPISFFLPGLISFARTMFVQS